MTLSIGTFAPDFTLTADNGTPVTLSSLRGKKVVLYFYPKDDTSGCTTEACDFRDNITQFRASGAIVLGISKDSVQSHKKFKDKYSLNFNLLSDEGSNVCELYGTWVEKSMYGRTYMGIERSTFLIDESGKITAIWRKVSVPGHTAEVAATISGKRIAANNNIVTFPKAAKAKPAKKVKKAKIKKPAKKAATKVKSKKSKKKTTVKKSSAKKSKAKKSTTKKSGKRRVA